MLRNQTPSSGHSNGGAFSCRGRVGRWVVPEVLDLYRSELWRARLRAWWSVLARRPHLLHGLAQTGTAGIARGSYSVGICAVPIRQIWGSENRSKDFDADFRPRQTRTRARWLSIATACLMGATMPAVQLLQVHDVYYVRDGHHRISVARALGQEYIEAEVMVWEPGAEPLCSRPASAPTSERGVFKRACAHSEVPKC